MVEVIEGLGELESVAGHVRGLARGGGALDGPIGFRGRQRELPEILDGKLPGESLAPQLAREIGQRFAPLFELAPDVARAHGGVLHVGAGLALEAERFLEIESNHGIARVFEQEIPQRADGDLGRDHALLFGRGFGVPGGDLGQRLFDELVDEVVRLDAEPLAAGHLDVGTAAILFGKLDAQLGAASGRERHHLVGEMHGARGLLGETELAQAGHDDVLEIALARIDDVVDARGVAERGPARRLGLGGRDPDHVPAVFLPGPVVEILPQQAELPELVGDVLADVGDGAVRAHDDLVVFVRGIARKRSGGHHEAAGVLAFGFKVNGLALFEQLEGRLPELQVQDLALTGQHVVNDAETPHGGEMAADDGLRYERGEAIELALAGFDGVEGFGAPGQRLRIVLVPGTHAREEIPAEVVEALREDKLLDLGGRLLLEEVKAHHDVRDLDAGVVDVVLRLDRAPARAQHADEGVAQHRIPQVADVRGLVGIDVGVLDDGLFGGLDRLHRRLEQGFAVSAAVEPHVDVAIAGDFERGDAGNGAEARDNLPADGLGRLTQLAREVKGHRQGQVAEARLFRLFDCDGGVDAVALAEVPRHVVQKECFDLMEHGKKTSIAKRTALRRSPMAASPLPLARGRLRANGDGRLAVTAGPRPAACER